MTIATVIRTAFAATLIVGVTASSMLIATDADARGGRGRGVYIQQYDMKKPLHGFEGRTVGGYYCSYKRLPKRVCTPTATGEKCRIVGWTLEQMCS